MGCSERFQGNTSQNLRNEIKAINFVDFWSVLTDISDLQCLLPTVDILNGKRIDLSVQYSMEKITELM
jgi:hypothetical protein